MYPHLLLHCQRSFPSALLYHQSCNYLPCYNPLFSCCHHCAAMLPPCSTDTATTAAVLPPPSQCWPCPPPCYHQAAPTATATTATTTPLPPPSCHCCCFLHCKISFIIKKNPETMQTLIAFDFLNYSDLASNSCMGGCIQYSTP
jgi:hypothetical protein